MPGPVECRRAAEREYVPRPGCGWIATNPAMYGWREYSNPDQTSTKPPKQKQERQPKLW
jgi:hypothetical protein